MCVSQPVEKPFENKYMILKGQFCMSLMEIAAQKYDLNYYGTIYGVLHDYKILVKDGIIKVLIKEEWVDISSTELHLELGNIDGPFSGDLTHTCGSHKELERLFAFIHTHPRNYTGFGV
eukprot:NODE_258_length_11607_cov_1.052659.p7 type:complete len:119 gc:universal NODE_258_length_11607_cov_1.052659:6316-6672(+)